MESISILGCRVDAVGRDEAVACIAALASGAAPAGANATPSAGTSATSSLVVTLGVEMVMTAQRDAAFRAIVNGAALVTCDTIGLLLASRLRGGPLRERVTGVELVSALAARSAGVGDLRLYLLGGSGDTAQRAASALRERAPGVQIAGVRDGFFSAADDAAVAAAVRASGANVVLAGLGSPKQERWLSEWLAATGCAVGIGIGGSLDVYAGNVQRAPALVQRSGFEWAYRLAKEPQRWRRQLALPQFAVAALGEALTQKRSPR